MKNNLDKNPVTTPLLRKREAAAIIGGDDLLSQLMRRRQIAFIRLGHRSIRFRLEDVQAALLRLTVKAVA
ncbi:MAG: hypothetical protein ACJ8NS_03090 [Chthoniobacterales bacterium]